jgi:hypothetical protein
VEAKKEADVAEVNEPENVPDIDELVAEIDAHSRRIKEALQDRLAAASTPEEALGVIKDLGAEMFETLIPLWADFSKSTAMEIENLNDEVFGIKLGHGAVDEIGELLTEYQTLSVGNPALSERIQRAIDQLEGGGDEDEDEGDEDEDEEDEGEGEDAN